MDKNNLIVNNNKNIVGGEHVIDGGTLRTV